MYGLVLKDLLMVARERAAPLLALAALASAVVYESNPLLGLYMGFMPAFVAAGWVCAHDYRFKADGFIKSLPGGRMRPVIARYVSVLVVQAVSFVLCFIGWAGWTAFGPGAAAAPFLFGLSVAIAGLLFVGFYLAGVYVLGFKNARWTNMIFLAVLAGAGALINYASDGTDPNALGHAIAFFFRGWADGSLSKAAYAIAGGISLALYSLFILLSWLAYRSREEAAA